MAIPEADKIEFKRISDAADDGNLIAIQGSLGGEQRTFLAIIFEDDDGFRVYPKAMILDERDDPRGPDGRPTEVG